ncbi:MAG: YtxH domain-containing protein [Nitrospirae bacterium]|nr:YtxH domain-containing protein [Nitrospirota bacterium]
MQDDFKKVGAAFLVGGTIGVVLALLYAPQSGRETRKDIAKTARRIRKDAAEAIDETIEAVNDYVDRVKDMVSDIVERGVDLSSDAKKEILKALEHGQKAIERQKDKIADAIKF